VTTRTFTVTVVNVSGNNKYFIDGVQQATLNLAEAGTYVFNWSDSSAINHPLRFSTTSDGTHGGGSEYTTGVTKNDGAYTTTITVAIGAPTLYYYCQYHPNMGGQANTVSATSWGMLSWNTGAWGNQADLTFSVTGVSATTSIGSVVADGVINTGWGRVAWGEFGWGIGGQVVASGVATTSAVGSVSQTITADLNVTGVSLTSSVGSVSVEVALDVTAPDVSLTSSVGSVVVTHTGLVAPTGLVATTSLGTASVDERFLVGSGWGRLSWGNQAWGVVYGVIPSGLSINSSVGTSTITGDCNISVTGVSVTSTVGAVAGVSTDILITQTGLGLTSSIGTSTVEITFGAVVTGVSATSAVGSVIVAPKIEVPVTNSTLTSSIGTVTFTITGSTSVTGVASTFSVGSIVPESIYSVTGVVATSAAGTPTEVTGEGIIDNVTGVVLTASTSASIIVVWSEIDTGTPITWTEITTAA